MAHAITYTFTVLDPVDQSERRIEIEVQKDHYLVDGMRIDNQQLGELGSLFIALSTVSDYDSITELLMGYRLFLRDFYQKLTRIQKAIPAQFKPN